MAIPDKPLTRTEQYLNRTATDSGTIPDVPLTRVEQYLAKIAGEDVAIPDVPYTRIEQYLDYIAENGGGGVDPESITLETLNVSSNGTTNAPSGKAYNKVVAAVPNSYAASDEGKVVSNGALVAQTAHAEVTQNGVVDTTLNNSVTVNVPQGSTPTGTKQISITENGTTTEDVAAYASAEITVNVPSGGGDYVAADWLDNSKPVGRVESTTAVNSYYPATFRGHTGITSVFLPEAVAFPDGFCYSAKSLQTFVAPKANNLGGTIFFNCTNLVALDIASGGQLGVDFIRECRNFENLILRGDTLSSLQSINSFRGSVYGSGARGGTIYISKVLYDHLGDGTSLDYKAATNWSTIDGYGKITWAQIEGSIYETQYVDGTPIPSA